MGDQCAWRETGNRSADLFELRGGGLGPGQLFTDDLSEASQQSISKQ